MIRALREAPEVDSAAEQARILEAAQNAVLQKYPAEAAAVADLLTTSAALLARQVGLGPEETKQLETELLQRAVEGLVQLGAKEEDIVNALVRNTSVFAEGQEAPELSGVNPQTVAAVQERVQQAKQAAREDTTPPVVSSGVFATDVQSTSAILHWGPALDDRTPFTDIRYRVLQSSIAADLSSLDQALALPAGAVVMPEAANVLRSVVSGLVPGATSTFAVIASDAAGNQVLYPSLDVTTPQAPLGPDTTRPGPGTGLAFSNITAASLTVAWGQASDDRTPPLELRYRLVMASDSTLINSVEKVAALAGEGVLFEGTSDLRKAAVSGLESGALYHFALLVRDGAGNSALYPLVSVRTADVEPPTVGSGLSFSNVTHQSVTVSWGAAIDDVTSYGDLEYRVVAADVQEKVMTVQSALLLARAAIKQEFVKSAAPLTVSGLSENETVFFAVLVRDAAGNVALYPPQSVTTRETQPPVPGAGLVLSDHAATSVRLSWGAAQDNVSAASGLEYRLVRASAAAEVDTIAEALAVTGSAVVLDWSVNTLTAVASGLSPGSTYHFALMARDDQGNVALYPLVTGGAVVAPQLTSHSAGQLLSRFYERFSGVCQNASDVVTDVQVTSRNPLNITPVNAVCASGSLSFELWIPAGSDPELELEITTSHVAEGWSLSTPVAFRYHAPCPKGYGGVPGLRGASGSGAWNDPLLNAGLGAATASYGHASGWLDPGRDFCVMKHPAKAQTSAANPEGGSFPIARGEQSFTMSNVIPDARASGRPWTNITQTDALAECGELNGFLFGAATPSLGSIGLLSSTQWQVVARNVEATAANWSGAEIGNGELARGHSDNARSSSAAHDGADFNSSGRALAGAPDDTRGFYGTGQSVGPQRRTQVLPNGEVVWDIAGNVWHWVRDLRVGLGIPGSDEAAGLNTTAWVSYLSGGSNRFSSATNRIFGGFGISGLVFSELENAGRVKGGTGGAVLRGGSFVRDDDAGIFATDLVLDTASGFADIGFRCALTRAPLTGTDTAPPVISSVRRTDGQGDVVTDQPVSVASGGNWNVAWDLSDSADPDRELWVEVRRRVSASPITRADLTDPVYAQGYGLEFLRNETGWVRDPVSGRYTVNTDQFFHYLITATDRFGNRSDTNAVEAHFTVEVHQSCPPGYIGVAGLNSPSSGSWNHPSMNPGLGNSAATYNHTNAWLDPGHDFCAMKYPAKAQTSPLNAEGGFLPVDRGELGLTMNQVIPDSRPSGRPWTNISQTDSLAECAELNTVFLGSVDPSVGSFALISNTQWQVLARSAEASVANWSGGAVGTGTLARGHSDDSMSGSASQHGADINETGKALSHVDADSRGFFGTGQSSGSQRRTQVLPNGQVVWDLGGNVWQWVRDLRGQLGITVADGAAGLDTPSWASLAELGNNTFSAVGNKIFGNFGSGGVQFSELQNAGQIYGGTGGAVMRGGAWYDGTHAGAFSASLLYGPSLVDNFVGFRCAFTY